MYRLSVDVGGTFTDLVAMEETTGEIFNIKISTDPKNPDRSVIEALKKFLEKKNPSQIHMVGHATTIATNALFGQLDLELPKIAFVTTQGFRDIIEIGRQKRAEVYNLFFQRPPMLVKRKNRYTIPERILHDGRILKPLSRDDLQKVADVIRTAGSESIAIGFLNSYKNPTHEKLALKVLSSELSDIPITISSQVSSGYREYERFSTTIVNASLIPIIKTYIKCLTSEIKKLGVQPPLFVMQSNGGLSSAEMIINKPVTIVESGPASGVIASAWLGAQLHRNEIISFDMGGTTAKAGIVRGMIPEVVNEYEVAGKVHMGRLLKGSGYPVNLPFIDLAECSAGGGTIAWVDEAESLNVGPLSAGANPGPACYGKGGDNFTITDANLLLGRLNQYSLLDGEMKINLELAKIAAKKLGDKLGLENYQVGSSVIKIANSIMSQILRIVSIERGYDPRHFTMIVFGGAGPMHACSLAEALEINDIIIPPNPGMFSALGLLTADIFHDLNRSYLILAEKVDLLDIENSFQDLVFEGKETLESQGINPNSIKIKKQIDMRYYGQSYEITIDYPNGPINNRMNNAVKAFNKRHNELYGYSDATENVELVNLRIRAIGKIKKPKLLDTSNKKIKSTPLDTRAVFFEGSKSWEETPVYKRKSLKTGSILNGPTIIEQYDSTTLLQPGWKCNVDRFGVLKLRRSR